MKNKLGKGFKTLLILSIIFLVLFIASFVVFALFANKMNDAELGNIVDVLKYFGLKIVDLFLFKFKFVSDAVYFALSCLLYALIVSWLAFLIVGIVVSHQRKRKVIANGIILTFINLAVYLIVVAGLIKYAHVLNNLKDIPLLVMVPTFGILGFGALYFLFAIFTYFAALVETFKSAKNDEIVEEPQQEKVVVQEAPLSDDEFVSEEDIRNIVREELIASQPFKVIIVGRKVTEKPQVEEVKEEPEPQPEPEPVKEELVPSVTFEEAAKEVWPQLENPNPLPEEEPEILPEPEEEEVVEEVEDNPAFEEEPAEEEGGATQEEWNRSKRQPFLNRILTADADIKANYNEIKNEILSYGVKAKLSRGGETFRLHEKKYVKIYLVGKTLKVYLALHPEDYKDSTIPVEDVGHRPNYADIPLLFKVRSGLSVRRCKELIKTACENDGLTQKEVKNTNWISEFRKLNAEKKKKAKEK